MPTLKVRREARELAMQDAAAWDERDGDTGGTLAPIVMQWRGTGAGRDCWVCEQPFNPTQAGQCVCAPCGLAVDEQVKGAS